MSKTTKNEVAKVDLNNLLPSDLNDADVFENVFEQLENADVSGALKEMTSEYLTFEGVKEGTKLPFIFVGMTTITDPDTGEVKEAVNLMNREQVQFISAATVIVGSLKKLTKIPCAVLLTYRGKVKGPKGAYHNVKVEALQP